MKILLISLVISLPLFGAAPTPVSGTPMDYKREKFKECSSPSCIYVLCEQGEIVDRVNFVPKIGCTKAMRKNAKGKFVLDFYEIGIKEMAFLSKEDGGNPEKPVGILFRFR